MDPLQSMEGLPGSVRPQEQNRGSGTSKTPTTATVDNYSR